MPADIAQGSPGMVAFGDMILFVLAAGIVGLIPTLFLLKLFVEKARAAQFAITRQRHAVETEAVAAQPGDIAQSEAIQFRSNRDGRQPSRWSPVAGPNRRPAGSRPPIGP